MYRSLFLLSVLLAGCSTAPVALQRPAQPEAAFTFNGRVAIRQGEQRDSAGVRWAHRTGADEILLLAPLGQTVARIRRDANEITLDASGKHYAAHNGEDLMQQVLGWQLPISGLRYWVTAMPAPQGDFTDERDALGRMHVLQQDGWEISYSRYAADTPDALPLRMKLRRDDTQVLLLIDEWEAQ
jgi:outer membrane lipoprotein LolB